MSIETAQRAVSNLQDAPMESKAVAMRALASMVMSQPEEMSKVIQAEGVQVIIAAVASGRADVELCRQSIALLCNLATREDCRRALAKHGRVDTIITAMSGQRFDLHLQSLGCALLWNLSADDRLGIALVKAEAIEAILRALQYSSADPELNLRAVAALSNICSTEMGQFSLLQNGDLEARMSVVLGAMEDSHNEPRVQEHSCRLLWHLGHAKCPEAARLARCRINASEKGASTTSMMELLLCVLQNQAQEPVLATLAYGALAAICKKARWARDLEELYMAAAEVVLQAMFEVVPFKNIPSDISALAQACRALGALCSDKKVNAKLVKEMPQLLQLIENASAEEEKSDDQMNRKAEFIENACCIITGVASDTAHAQALFDKHGEQIIECITVPGRRLLQYPEVQIQLCAALSRIGMASGAFSTMVRRGVPGQLQLIVEEHPDDHALHSAAMKLLLEISWGALKSSPDHEPGSEPGSESDSECSPDNTTSSPKASMTKDFEKHRRLDNMKTIARRMALRADEKCNA